MKKTPLKRIHFCIKSLVTIVKQLHSSDLYIFSLKQKVQRCRQTIC